MNKIPPLDLKKQIAPLRNEIDEAVKRVVDSAGFILGSEVAEFEKEVSAYTGAKYAVGVANGTDAIRLSLLALGIRRGDGVLCPAFTYYATAGAIASMGAVPVFADIDRRTYNISAASVEKVLKEKGRAGIKAIIPVHLYGMSADMDDVRRIAKTHGLKVIEDTAQAFGAEYKGRKAGTLGDCGSVSFFPGKNLGAFGDAGMVLTNDEPTAALLRLLRNQGNKEKYYHTVIGYNSRLDTLQAAVLRVKLPHLDAWNKKRQENAAYYNRELAGLSLETPAVASYSTHIYHQYVIWVKALSAGLFAHLKDKGVDARVFYPVPLHLQECFSYLRYQKGDFPVSEEASVHTLAIPVHPDLTKEEKDYIVGSIKELIGQ